MNKVSHDWKLGESVFSNNVKEYIQENSLEYLCIKSLIRYCKIKIGDEVFKQLPPFIKNILLKSFEFLTCQECGILCWDIYCYQKHLRGHKNNYNTAKLFSKIS